MVRFAQVAHAIVLLLGLVFVGSGIVLLSGADYTIAVEPVSDGEVPETAEPVDYELLSADGRAAFDEARRADDGTTAVTIDARPPAFEYGDAAGDHYVVYAGDTYRVTTGGGGTLSGVDEIAGRVLVVVGVIVALVGGIDFYRHCATGE